MRGRPRACVRARVMAKNQIDLFCIPQLADARRLEADQAAPCAFSSAFRVAQRDAEMVTSICSGSRPSTRTSTLTAMGQLRVRAFKAGPSPCSARNAGWIPRTYSHSSSSTLLNPAMARFSSEPSSRSSRGTAACTMRNRSAIESRRCRAPSCRSRSIRRRVSSALATTRARDSISWACVSALAIAAAASSANSATRCSGSGRGDSKPVPVGRDARGTVDGLARSRRTGVVLPGRGSRDCDVLSPGWLGVMARPTTGTALNQRTSCRTMGCQGWRSRSQPGLARPRLC
jgi:hypothetical protein